MTNRATPHHYASPLSILTARQGRQASQKDLAQAMTDAGLCNVREFGVMCSAKNKQE